MSDSQLSVQVLKERTCAVVRGMIWVDANKFEHMSVTRSNGEVVEISNEDMRTCGIVLMNWLLSLLNSTVAACQGKRLETIGINTVSDHCGSPEMILCV